MGTKRSLPEGAMWKSAGTIAIIHTGFPPNFPFSTPLHFELDRCIGLRPITARAHWCNDRLQFHNTRVEYTATESGARMRSTPATD